MVTVREIGQRRVRIGNGDEVVSGSLSFNCFAHPVIEEFKEITIPVNEINFIKHYWVDSWYQLFAKHWKYIRLEGEAKYKKGTRFTFRYFLWKTKETLKTNLFEYKGIRGGWRGIFLSLFYTWYVSMSLLSLWCYQRKIADA